MEISAGSCTIKKDGTESEEVVESGSSFEIAANSGFSITVSAVCQYICSYL